MSTGNRRHAIGTSWGERRRATVSSGSARDWHAPGAGPCQVCAGASVTTLGTWGSARLPNEGDQPPRPTDISGVGVAEACLQRGLFDPYPAGEADQGTEHGDEETQPIPQ